MLEADVSKSPTEKAVYAPQRVQAAEGVRSNSAWFTIRLAIPYRRLKYNWKQTISGS